LRLDIIPALIIREFEITLPAGYKYNYNHNSLFDLITYCLNEINSSRQGADLELAFRNFKIENLESEDKDSELIIKGCVIANKIKNQEEVTTIKAKLNNIIKDIRISSNLIALRTSRETLRKSLEKIHRLSIPISQTIQSGDYDIKADCCPTVWGLVRKYVF
jgi:hypothetical protein